MSFMRALATVAVGMASSKSPDKQAGEAMGALAGLQGMFPTGDGNPADQLAKMAEQFGLGGGADQIKEMMSQFSIPGLPGMADMPNMTPDMAGVAGLGGLMASLQGAALATGTQTADLMSALFGGTPVGDAMETQAKLMLRAMIQAAKADGDIDAEEKAKIMAQLGDEITAEEKAFVQEQMEAPFDLQALAKDTGAATQEQVYSMSLSTIRVDNPAESEYLNALARAMGMTEDQRNEVHQRMGIPPVSS